MRSSSQRLVYLQFNTVYDKDDETIRQFGFDGAAAENLSVESGAIAFQISVGSETISYDGRINGPWIIGHGDLGSVRFPFLLRRAP